jgi:hypothetical protein
VEDFVAAGRWIAAFDVLPPDLDALDTYTGFDVADGERTDRSEMFVFRVAKVGGTPMVEMINSGPFAQPGTTRLGDRRQEEVREGHLRRVARIVDSEITLERGTGTKLAGKGECEPLTPPPNSDGQHVAYCYLVTGEQAPPNGHWSEKSNPWWLKWKEPSHAPGKQTATWTMRHRFDVFLENSVSNPGGNFQSVYYDLKTEVDPAKDGQFYRMASPGDYLTLAHPVQNRVPPERAWWTARIEPKITPSASTSAVLQRQGVHPENQNAETTYSSGEEWNVSFAISGTGGSLQNVAGGGAGVNFGYSSNKSKTWTIPEWGVENEGSHGVGALHWLFTAREPCDARLDTQAEIDECFGISPGYLELGPKLPTLLSRKEATFNASGKWHTTKLLAPKAPNAPTDPNTGLLNFTLATPVTLFDTWCRAQEWEGALLAFNFCSKHRRDVHKIDVADDVKIDVSRVDPIPIKEITLKPNPANGATREKVTGTVTLERKAQIAVTIRLFSNNRNADIGTPVGGSGDVTEDTLTIDPTKSSGTFTVLTNDNGLDAQHDHSTATITAFYTKPVRTQLTIKR